MTLKKKDAIRLEITPTVFPDLNKTNNFSKDHETSELTVNRMKHKHFRAMQAMKEEEQIHYIMSELSGLSQLDVDELDAEDSARLSEIIFGFMKKYAEIAKQMFQ